MLIKRAVDEAEEAGLASFVGIGQGTTAYHMVDSQMIHTRSIGSKTEADLPQGTEVAQHGIEHNYQVRIPVEMLRVVVRTAFRCQSVIFCLSINFIS